eukprot:2530280-Amphidinium_carterae.3
MEQRRASASKVFLVEFCCESDSALGNYLVSGFTEVCRLTQNEDVTKQDTIRKTRCLIESKVQA